MPDMTVLYHLAQELYSGTGNVTSSGYSGTIQLDTKKAALFLTQSPGGALSWFSVWARVDDTTTYAHYRSYNHGSSGYSTRLNRYDNADVLAVCLGE